MTDIVTDIVGLLVSDPWHVSARDFSTVLWASAYATTQVDASFSVDLGEYTVTQYAERWHVFQGAKDITRSMDRQVYNTLVSIAVEYKLGIRTR